MQGKVTQVTQKKRDILSRAAALFEASFLARQLLFVVLAFFTILLSGYYFGTFDQSIHIPFLKKEIDPTLFPGDPFFDLRKTHFSYFWYMFHPFYKAGLLEIGLFLVHFFATYLTFWAVWRLSVTLFRSSSTAFLCVLAIVLPHLGFAAFPLFEFSLLNRTFVFPFLLLSIEWYLKKQYLRSFFLLGLLFNLHALSVNFVIFMYAVDIFLQYLRGGLKDRKKAIGIAMVVFVAAALPVLIWKFGKSPIDFTLRYEWFEIITRSLMYTVFYPISTFPNVLLLTGSGVSAFLIYFMNKNLSSLSPYARNITNFFYAALTLIVLEVFVSFWFPVTVLVQFQIVRIGIFVLLFGYLFYIHAIVSRYQNGQISGSMFAMLFASVAISPTPIVPFLIGVLSRIARFPLKIFIGWLVIGVCFCLMGWYAFSTDIWRPGISLYPQKTDWVAVQLWAKTNTPKDALFVTPPERWWLFEPDWRVFSERSTLVTLSEVLEFAFTPEYTDSWKTRFSKVAPGALDQFGVDILESKRQTRDAYESLSDEQLQSLATEYNLSYIVVARPRVLPFPLVYQNDSFSVYRFPRLFALAR